MDTKINEDYLIVLKKDNNRSVFIDFVKNSNPLITEQEKFNLFFNRKKISLNQLIEHIENSDYISQIYSPLKYCENLTGIYQHRLFFKNEIIRLIKIKIHQLNLELKKEIDLETNDKVKFFLEEIKNDFAIGFKSYSINLSYKKCLEDKNILAFSHRIAGWSNPIYNLNENFSIEIKSNFGFGYSSYFFVIIKYKNIEITPFSDWINYEHAKFSEIIRYTKSFTSYKCQKLKNGNVYYKPIIYNSCWEKAMIFFKDTCNLSMNDETKFIEKFIIEECEKMVCSLENMLISTNFELKDRLTNKYYNVDKKGHYLMEFRGEKISGSLEFINKILDFKYITKIDNFITRLENCNLKIYPSLSQELEYIKSECDILKLKQSKVKSLYDKLLNERIIYNKKIDLIRTDVFKTNKEKELNHKETILNQIINQEFPEYQRFNLIYDQTKAELQKINEQIDNLNLVRSNISEYQNNIEKYFINK